MNNRYIQNFLMASAAFFAIGGPARADDSRACAAANGRMLQLAPAGGVDALANPSAYVRGMRRGH
ncbi:hypothetical protein [Burkholderia sp. TSV86]|uniref:hypothetical protein n=1 Tax=Burkholderia sp. TSV86 TaxID=1385594 RepID=UPI00075B1EE1|nr:hypothetical protein [Burkholderia sp. TSV86]KVE35957.1 hypothetical protein WS68_05665 [Burkholderia sp. TSV86]